MQESFIRNLKSSVVLVVTRPRSEFPVSFPQHGSLKPSFLQSLLF